MQMNLLKPMRDGHLDSLEIEPYGVLRLYGWSQARDLGDRVTLEVDGQRHLPLNIFRTYRPDVKMAEGSPDAYAGFQIEFRLNHPTQEIKVFADDVSVARIGTARLAEIPFHQPAYFQLLDTESVYHRENIYGHGPPNCAIPAVLAPFLLDRPGPVLDFGCGAGHLVAEYRQRGQQATGIEIDCPMIRDSISAELQPHIHLYDGSLPLPFEDGQFETAVASEVLEHVEPFEEALRELHRVARQLVLTVPDISSIPYCFQHGVVPWHLLEATHVNFFTRRSLAKVLAPLYESVAFYRLGNIVINGTFVPGSLGAVCEKKRG